MMSKVFLSIYGKIPSKKPPNCRINKIKKKKTKVKIANHNYNILKSKMAEFY